MLPSSSAGTDVPVGSLIRLCRIESPVSVYTGATMWLGYALGPEVEAVVERHV